jgi:hypothetical protein
LLSLRFVFVRHLLIPFVLRFRAEASSS